MLKDEIQEIVIPKESIADDSVLLLKWYKENGAKVKKGDNIANCETSKAVFDIESPTDGYLFYQYKVGDEIPVGNLLAIISNKSSFSFDTYNLSKEEENQIPKEKVKFSKIALQLIEKNDLRKEMFYHLNMVTKEDVLNYLNQFIGDKNKIYNKSNTLKPNSQKIVILGGGGHSKMCIDIINQMKTYEIIGIISSDIKIGSKVIGIPVIAKDRDEDLKQLYNRGVRLIVNGVGADIHLSIREKIYKRLKENGFYIPNIIHPKASVEPSVSMGEGNQIMANAIIGSCVKIGNNCIINSGAIVSHDSILENNVHIAPGAILAGRVFVGKNSLIGMGSTIYLHIKIGEHVIICNNCSITKNVSNNIIIKNNFIQK